ncbi:hypothetical protein MNEG_11654 [Monoraphidium neglectum]|uniref:Uncharacterized protein n=1 Tax=Monoraphidium neglectum TaxID=145388 RepID=A0A0D2M4U8_9CHLO|nr:hypothetical protein MNEG_11654 [Monoraphidium neglectum]KIY96306.1 hypothetical protein MNEG_11654 [Monoraphidium neglectum]|eukprot:XP_013895326.1 hypothetical protein MNEG_11654 [Monoraphidium neglectum]
MMLRSSMTHRGVASSGTSASVMRTQRAVPCAAAGSGFGKTASKKKVDLSGGIAIPAPKEKKEKAAPQQQQQPLDPKQAAAAAAAGGGSDWAVVGKVAELFTLEKPSKAIILPSGIKLCPALRAPGP